MKQHKTKKIILYLILLSFLSIKIFYLLNQKGLLWDSAVYIGMGKYIFTLGKVGLWEPARPLIWPVFIGFLWKLGLNPIIFGRIAELIFSLGCIYLTYLIGKDVFNEKIALLSAFFLAFSPTFLFYSSTILTGIPSTFFALLSIYFLIKKNYFSTGLFLALSFITRFLQLFILIPIIFALVKYNKKKLRKIMGLVYGFLIISLPYLVLNTFLYKNPLYPPLLQIFMTQYTGWAFHQPLSFYSINLLKENFLILFAIIGTIAILKQKGYKKITILNLFLLFFIFFNSIAHKEIRFILVFLPYIYLITSCGIFKTINITKKKKTIVHLIGIVTIIILLIQITSQTKIPKYEEYPEFTNYLKINDIKDGIWISNPLFIINTNKKADELIYYPLYNSKKIDILKEKLPKAKHILIRTCDILPCPPTDKNCPNKTINFLDSLKKDFKIVHYKKENSCEQFIFRITSLY